MDGFFAFLAAFTSPIRVLTSMAESALKWLRQSHQARDSKGALEFALLLVEEPELANEAGRR